MARVSSMRNHKNGTMVKMTCTPSSLPINVGARLWTWLDRTGEMEVVVCDDTTIRKRASVTARDLRTAFSNSSTILGREKAIIISLQDIKAIITAKEVLLLEPLRPEVSTLIERLKQQFPQKNSPENVKGLKGELPFEFQVLKIALDVFCSYVHSNVETLEKVSKGDLKNLLSLRSNLICSLACVHKVRDEIKHLLDDKEDMADLYLTRKWIQNQLPDSTFGGKASTTSNRNFSMVTEEDDVEDLEMLLEEYFIEIEEMRNSILIMKLKLMEKVITVASLVALCGGVFFTSSSLLRHA